MRKTLKEKAGAETRGMNHNRPINHHQLITKRPDTESESFSSAQSLASFRERERGGAVGKLKLGVAESRIERVERERESLLLSQGGAAEL